MIEPQSAQEGASAWAAKVTWPLPMPRLPRVMRGLPLGGGVAAPAAPAGEEPLLGRGAETSPLPEAPKADPDVECGFSVERAP